MNMKEHAPKRMLWVAMALAAVLTGACEKKGPVEQVGEEVDEAVDTIKNGGEETAATKIDDAVDELRD